jgi:hypothetical protein
VVMINVTANSLIGSSVAFTVSGIDSSLYQVATSSPLYFPAVNSTDLAVQTISIGFGPDNMTHPAQTVTVTLTSPSGAILGSQVVATIIVKAIDNQYGVVGFLDAAGPYSVSSAQTSINMTLWRDAANASTLVAASVTAITNDSACTFSGPAQFAAGSTIAMLQMNITKGGAPTLGRSVQVTLQQVGNTPVGFDNTTSVWIAGFNSPYGLLGMTVATLSVSPNQQGTVYVSRAAGTTGAISTQLIVTPGTAPSSQYSYSHGALTLSWADGTFATQSFTFNVLDDGTPKLARWFTIQLSNLTTTGMADIDSTHNIVNVTIPASNNPYGLLGWANASMQVEEGGMVYLTVQRTYGTFSAVSVQYTMYGPSQALAEFGSLTAGTFQFAAGATTSTISIQTMNDNIPQDIRTVTVVLSAPTNGAVLDSSNANATITITDYNDLPAGQFQLGSLSLPSSVQVGSNFTVNIVRTVSAIGSVTVYFGPSAQYASRIQMVGYNNYTVAFSANQYSIPVTFVVLDDQAPHNVTAVTMTLGLISVNYGPVLGARLNAAASQFTFTIQPVASPKGIFGFVQANANINTSKGQNITIPVVRSGGSQGSFSIAYSVIGTAGLQVSDYSNGLLSFAAGVSSVNIALGVIDDGIPQLLRTFNVSIIAVSGSDPNNPVNATGPFISTNTITTVTVAPSHDPYGRFSFQMDSNVTVSENVGNVSIVVNRLSGSFGAVNVTFSIQAATLTLGSDFSIIPSNMVLTFAAGQSFAYITLVLNNDNIPEPVEYVTLALSSVSPSTVPNGTAVPIIDPSWATVTVSASDDAYGLFAFQGLDSSTFSEGYGIVNATVLRLVGQYGQVRVLFSATQDSTAVAGTNYDLTLNPGFVSSNNSGWLEFQDSQSTGVLYIRLHNIPHESVQNLLGKSNGGTVSLSMEISTCEYYDTSSGQWLASEACNVQENNDIVTMSIIPECTLIACQNGGTCVDDGKKTAYCSCKSGKAHTHVNTILL